MISTTVNNQAVIPVSGGEDARAEFGHLVSGCTLLDLRDRARVTITGADRVRWLNGMITNNVRDLPTGQGTYAFLLNPQGHILGDLYAYNRGDSLLVETDQAQLEKLLAAFDHYIIMDDVEIASLGATLAGVGIAGPLAAETLRSVGLEMPSLRPLQFVEVTLQNKPFTLVCGDNPAIEKFELWSTAQNVASAQAALQQAGARPVGSAARELARIAAGIPRYGQDIRERDLPQETGQERALNFNKGCYIGQEIVERIRSRGAVHRTFTGFEVQGLEPAPGTKIQSEGKDVGELTSVASLPTATGDRVVALGYLRREAATPGKELHAGETILTVAGLPFSAAIAPRNR